MTQDEFFALIQSEVKMYCDRFKGRYEVYPDKKANLVELARFFGKYSERYEWNVDLISVDPVYSKDALVRVRGEVLSFYGPRLVEFIQVLPVIDAIEVSCIKEGDGCLDVKFVIKDFWKEV